MNNEAEDWSLPGPVGGDGRSIPGQYKFNPYVCSEGKRMVRQTTRRLSKVLVPLAIAIAAYWLIMRYLHSDLHDDLMDHRATMFDDPAVFVISFLIISVTLTFFVVGVTNLYFDSGTGHSTSPVLPFLVKESLSCKTSMFSPRRYWITEDDIAEIVNGEVEFLTGPDDYPAPAQRRIKWVSSDDQEERTGLATMIRPDVVILTDEHNRPITPDMITWYEDDDEDEES